MKNTNEPKPVSKNLKRFFGIGDFGFGMMANIDTFYATFFFTNIAKFSLSVITIMTTISAVVDAVLSCIYGPFLNRIKPAKWGRYRSWLVLTPWMVPFLYALQFVRIGNGIAAVILITVAMIASRIAWNLPYVANVSMINIAGKNPKDRLALSSTRMIWTSLASVAYSYVGPAVVALFAAMLGEKNSYAATAFVFAALMAAGFYAHFVMFKGYEPTGEEELELMRQNAENDAQKTTGPKVHAMDAILCNPHLIALFLSDISKSIVLFMVNGLAIYYFTYVSKNAGLLSRFLLVANLLAVVAAYGSKYLAMRFSAKKTVVAAYLGITVIALISFCFYQNSAVVIPLMCCVCFMTSCTSACTPELYSNCAGYSKEKLGYDVTGTVMGLLAVPIKIAIVFRGILISACLALANFVPGTPAEEATAELQRGISIGFMVLPAIVTLLGALILGFGYKLKSAENK